MTTPEKSLKKCIRSACKQVVKISMNHFLSTLTEKAGRECYTTFRNPRTGKMCYRYSYMDREVIFECTGASLDSCRAKRDLAIR